MRAVLCSCTKTCLLHQIKNSPPDKKLLHQIKFFFYALSSQVKSLLCTMCLVHIKSMEHHKDQLGKDIGNDVGFPVVVTLISIGGNNEDGTAAVVSIE